MKGFPSHCSICGAPGNVLGCPSFFDACTDKDACRTRVAEQRECLEAKLRRAEKALEKEVESRVEFL